MSAVYKWFLVLESLPPTGSEDNLHLELTRKLDTAMRSGELKVYDKNVKLLSPPKTIGLSHHLVPDEVNIWFKKNNLPYTWLPAVNFKAKTLSRLKSALKSEAIDVVKELRAKGTSTDRINKTTVSAELIKRVTFNHYASSTIERAIEANWWKESS
jgi:hypothetical protein